MLQLNRGEIPQSLYKWVLKESVFLYNFKHLGHVTLPSPTIIKPNQKSKIIVNNNYFIITCTVTQMFFKIGLAFKYYFTFITF